jgi:carbamoyltransferase
VKILGLSFMYHDSAACLLVDGDVVAAAGEERFSRKKHSLDFPRAAITSCLETGGLQVNDLDAIIFYEKPLQKFERIVTMSVEGFPKGFRLFADSMPLWVKYKLFIDKMIRENLDYKGEIAFADHHYAHAASTFYASGFDEASILTMDGVGEWATMCRGRGKDNRIHLTHELRYPHSIGLLYSTVTAFLGFRVNGGEGKVMGLSSYGEPAYYDRFMKDVLHVQEDGSFQFNLDYFSFYKDLVMFSPKFIKDFGPPREPESELTKRDEDMAATLQKVTETVVLNAARSLYEESGLKRICIAGGVGLNSVTNGLIMEQLPYEDIFIQPASGDDGGAIGSALYYYHQVKGGPRKWQMKNAYLGPRFDPDEIEQFLIRRKVPYRRFKGDDNALLDQVSQDLANGLIVGWMQGRMEYGPRALGNRSILANPTLDHMKDTLNARVKFREHFRPFAPTCLADRVGDFFTPPLLSPFMLLVVKTRPDKVDKLPAITHVDGTARLQTITREQNPRYYDLIQRFGERTGVPVILNTSFNVRGEPIVCDYGDALECFLNTGMDRLVIEDCYVVKEDIFPDYVSTDKAVLAEQQQ